VTLQGNTDRKVLRARPDLAGTYRSVWHEAEAVFAFAPWIADWCSERLGQCRTPPISLPCITNAQQLLAPQAEVAPRVISAFNLNDWRNKNIANLVAAMAELRKTVPNAQLEIAGSGAPESEAAVDAIIRDAGAEGFVCRIGKIDPANIQQWMNGAAAFAMPSQRESFGMVFVEALLSGCPIVYSRGTAVDGYFPGAPFARACDPGNASDIAANLGAILESRAEAVSALERWQAGEAQRFLAPAILKAYGDEMERLADGAAGED
jgi:glycosyltransferase involved in cell wall biosynthesis